MNRADRRSPVPDSRGIVTVSFLVLLWVSDVSAQPQAFSVRTVPGEPSQLYSLDFATGERKPIGPLGVPFVQGALTHLPSGELVAVEAGGAFLSIDPTTGQVTLIGDLGIPIFYISGLTADACGRLWLLGLQGDGWHLYRIDPTTGAAEERGALPETIEGLAARGEELFGIAGERVIPAIVQIDPGSAGLTDVADLDRLPDFYISRWLDFVDSVTLLELGWPVIPLPVPPFNQLHQIDLVGAVVDGPSFDQGTNYEGLAVAPPPGLCPGAPTIDVPAVSSAGLAALALLLAGLGAATVRRRARCS